MTDKEIRDMTDEEFVNLIHCANERISEFDRADLSTELCKAAMAIVAATINGPADGAYAELGDCIDDFDAVLGRESGVAKELKDCTVAELLDEVNSRDDVFTASAWMRIDVEEAFDDARREYDDATIDRFMEEFIHSFNARENDEGFERLNIYITELFD